MSLKTKPWNPKDNYKIISTLWFGRRPGKEDVGYICYRTILVHAICQTLTPNSEQTSFYENFFDAYWRENNLIKTPLELLWSKEDKDNKALTLVDRSGGCYPLVFYSVNPTKYSDRLTALNNAVKDIQPKIEQIYKEYEKHNFVFDHKFNQLLTNSIYKYEN